jgi:hypothetical protein
VTAKYKDFFDPKDISIAQLWTIFAGAVLPADASPVQRQEMRKAFYAGFIEAFRIMTEFSADLPQDEAMSVLDRLNVESLDFVKGMVAELKATPR